MTRKVEAAEQALATRNGRRPDDRELAEATGQSVEALVELRGRVQQGVLMTLDHAFDDAEGSGVAHRLHDRSASTPDEKVESAEVRGYVRDALHNLPQRLRTVAVGIYLENRSFDELAEGLGVTPSRVSQLRSEAVTMIREGVEAQYVAPSGAACGRVARRKASYAAEISRASTWRQRLMAAEERIMDAPGSAPMRKSA
jgi:RNA polymerase sigma factor for flagellar operon FliA